MEIQSFRSPEESINFQQYTAAQTQYPRNFGGVNFQEGEGNDIASHATEKF